MSIFEKDPVDYIASKNAEHNKRLLCAQCNMFGSIEDVPGAAGGMEKIGDDWYHRFRCSEDAIKVKEIKNKPSAEVIDFPLRKEIPKTQEEKRKAA